MTSRIAIVTRARAPYHKALQEAFAESLGPDSTLRLFYPANSFNPFDETKTLPLGPNITTEWINSARVDGAATAMLARFRTEAIGTQLPSRALWKSLADYRPDLIWAHEFSPYTLASVLFAKRNRIPVVVSSDVGQSNRASFPWMVRLWHKLWGHLADGIIACTPAARRPLSGERIPVIEAYHAADSRKLTPSPAQNGQRDDTTTFVYVGRIIPVKGIDLLLAAAARLKQSGQTNWKMKFIGPDHQNLGATLIEKFQLQDHVHITGFKDGQALATEFASGDAFVIATRQDTYAAVVHEAACLGLPLIVSQHAGAAEALVRENQNGHVIDPEDTATFAARLKLMLRQETRTPMRAESRKTGEHFSAHIRATALRLWMKESFAI